MQTALVTLDSWMQNVFMVVQNSAKKKLNSKISKHIQFSEKLESI